ncbi:MAG: DNA topoisomerase IV subunit B, partial [Aeriscardovia sp.]|nr:DNA topoisomerase IV subunit B [Aeriscardovia sp.]
MDDENKPSEYSVEGNENLIHKEDLKEGELNSATAPEHYGAKDLRVLEGLEAVRLRPGMYIGSTGPRGLHHLVYEIVDNSVDEALAGYATHIEVTILPDDGIRVVDDGRGIPVGIVPGEGKSGVEVVMTKLHAGGKFGGGGYTVSGGLHGVGISVVNALSTRMEVVVKRDGHEWTQTYLNQRPTAPLARGRRLEEGESTGTSVTFWPDPRIFQTTVYDFETLRTRFQQTAFLNKGLKISLTDERKPTDPSDEAADDAANEKDNEAGAEETERKAVYQYKDGIKDYVKHLASAKRAAPIAGGIISFAAEDEKLGISADVALQWTGAYTETLRTFANTITTTEGGAHEEGFKAALTGLINRYAREKGILRDKDDNLS